MQQGGTLTPRQAPVGVSVLGSTGSIGRQTLDIIQTYPERFFVSAMTAGSNADLLIEQALAFRPRFVAIADPSKYDAVRAALEPKGIRTGAGMEAVCEAACWADTSTVVAAIVGVAGLRPVLAALKQGSRIALANKETLVAAGSLVMSVAETSGATLVPVDSEHSAIFQCLQGEDGAVDELVLTASGGALRQVPLAELPSVRPTGALNHPNWDMGAKITIDSATMMNKGLEVIEARWLFDIPADRIRVLIHPESIIHSMVSFVDGSTKAQLGLPDMRVPIQYALTYPARLPGPIDHPRWAELHRLHFSEPEPARYPCLALAYAALVEGGLAPTILNAANEAAVGLFLDERIRYTDIAGLVADTLEVVDTTGSTELATDLDHIEAADRRARRCVMEHNLAAVH